MVGWDSGVPPFLFHRVYWRSRPANVLRDSPDFANGLFLTAANLGCVLGTLYACMGRNLCFVWRIVTEKVGGCDEQCSGPKLTGKDYCQDEHYWHRCQRVSGSVQGGDWPHEQFYCHYAGCGQ